MLRHRIGLHTLGLTLSLLLVENEKVIRIALSALRNCLKHSGLSGDIVEKGTLEVLQQNEYEKWRDL